jgi:hypothetical protein
MWSDPAAAPGSFQDMSLRRLLIALPLAAALGCGGDSTLVLDPEAPGRIIETGIELALDKPVYSRGDPVTVTMTNRSSRNYGFNLCARSFERREGDVWVAMPLELRLCTLQMDGLAAGAVRTQSTDLHSDAGPGVYRLLVGFTHMAPDRADANVVARSVPFTIQ